MSLGKNLVWLIMYLSSKPEHKQNDNMTVWFNAQSCTADHVLQRKLQTCLTLEDDTSITPMMMAGSRQGSQVG